jgi:hypothetical protein
MDGRVTHQDESDILQSMTKRLQVLLEDDELAEIQAHARQRRQTTAAWVREALRAARTAADYPLPETRLRAVREAAALAFPIADLDQLLAEIESGYGADDTSLAVEPKA